MAFREQDTAPSEPPKRRGRPPKKAQEMWSEAFLRKVAVDTDKEWDKLSRPEVEKVIDDWQHGRGSRRA